MENREVNNTNLETENNLEKAQVKLSDLKDANNTYKKFYQLDVDTQNKVLENTYGKKDEVVEEKKGGSYGELYTPNRGDTEEIHHMPAASVSPLDRFDGPAIRMEKEEHRLTASCGSSHEAREYRQEQKKLIDEGKFTEAFKMDVEDLKVKGLYDKYKEGVKQASEYVSQLKQGGIING